MNLQEIEERVAQLDLAEGQALIYSLLLAYGLPNASISRLKSGTYNRSTHADETLWKGKVLDRYVDGETVDLHALIDDAANADRVQRERPRFVVVRSAARLLAIDIATKDTLDIRLADLGANAAFFLPWAGIEKQQLESLHYADVKAAEKMARLYEEIVKANDVKTIDDVNSLNVFFARLLFCFFAEDTGVFPKGAFTDAVASLTNASGDDTGSFLDALFLVLNTPPDCRAHIPAHFLRFDFVNGSLFDVTAPSPRFTAKARSIVIASGTLDWSQINPDIFGSMMQAVVHPGDRQVFGMHYTSVENILKVIRPLFIDSLQAQLDTADTVPKLRRFITRLSKVRIFDPACGSGNFLVISYKELRRLEHSALRGIGGLDPSSALFTFSDIKLESFYGIEIDGFAHEVAMLALWIAKHQMNVEFKELFGAEIPLIPLRDSGCVEWGNATQLDWEQVCPKDDDGELYLIGNPPYLGSHLQTAEHKAEFAEYFGTERYPRDLDYIALWFIKGARYVADRRAELAFVTTNSVSQGDHVGLMWPLIYEQGVEVVFAHQSFRWTNQARGNAGVTVAVIGLSAIPRKERILFTGDGAQRVPNIGPYLHPTADNVIIHSRRRPLAELQTMLYGSKPTDGGHLSLTAAEREAMLSAAPEAARFIRRYLGADEFLGDKVRYCLWISPADTDDARAIRPIAERIERVAATRTASSKAATRALAKLPWRFAEPRHQPGTSIIIPLHSSERRAIIPMGFLDSSTVISNAANAIYGAELWLFALLQSRLHTAWVGTVGGKIKTDYRYSATLCYNTFPVPLLTDEFTLRLREHAMAILEAREYHADQRLGDLYLPDKMPPNLRRAHDALDDTVDDLYKLTSRTDTERVVTLFALYEQMIAAEAVAA